MTFLRAFPTDLKRTGPRQLTGRLVPYDEPTYVMDELPGGPDIYQEGFRPGAFSRQANTTEKGVLSRIGLIHSHDGGVGYLGPFTALREGSDGLYGEAAILRSRAGDVDDLLDSGVRELSIEFHVPQKDHTEVDGAGIRWRTRAHLHHVALEPKGAYSSAQVLAYRARMDEQAQEQAETESAEAEVARQLEVEAAARRRRWEELAGRAEVEAARQAEMIKSFGVTKPGGFGSLAR